MTGFPISLIISKGIDLYQFDWNDWEYDPHFDIVLVRENSPIETWLTLAFEHSTH